MESDEQLVQHRGGHCFCLDLGTTTPNLQLFLRFIDFIKEILFDIGTLAILKRLLKYLIMKERTKTENGDCFASIKAESEISEIQVDLSKAEWIEKTIRYLEAIKDGTRFKIVYLLLRHERLCVRDLANILDVSSSAISQHLRKLKDMDLVTAFRQKQTLFYSLKNGDFKRFVVSITNETKNR